MSCSLKVVKVAARSSPLSRAQVKEVQRELAIHHPSIELEGIFVQTTGDLDQATSLRTLGRTDFFSKEVDALVLQRTCRIAVHSAKDLPESLAEGLAIVCLTLGQDAADVLVIREGESLQSLRQGALIATSSERREVAARKLRENVTFCDVRGTIEQRLALLNNGKADGVVIAEAALIRLGLTHLNRVRLPGPSTALQGQLAIVAQIDDEEMRELFACLDTRVGVA